MPTKASYARCIAVRQSSSAACITVVRTFADCFAEGLQVLVSWRLTEYLSIESWKFHVGNESPVFQE